ncbi:MAG: serine hydrolase [Chitinophagaceae bacterium]|nr:serine hydrolase [Chitinophagaceae bacterium]
MSLVYGAGALRSTVSDLYKWHQALYEGKLIKNESFFKAIQPHRLADGKQIDYCYGFFNKTENGINSIGHGGAIDGFRAIEMYYPNQDIFITLLCNSETDNFERFFQSISNTCRKAGGRNNNRQLYYYQLISGLTEFYLAFSC